MDLVLVLFYIFGSIAVGAAVFLLFTKNVLYAAFGLLLTLLSLAAIFVLLFADFIAITQLMVYVGGVLVLILFGVMLSNRVKGKAIQSESINPVGGTIVASALFAGLTYLILSVQNIWQLNEGMPTSLPAKTSITEIGIRLITNFALPFEVTSLILLIALIGAAFISTEEKND